MAIRFRPQERYTQYASKPKVKHLRLLLYQTCTVSVPFQRIEKDRDFAPAFAGLADTYLALLNYRYIAPNEALGLATAAAVNALRLDERLADAHTSQAHAKMHALDWRGAEQEFQKAIQLGPGYAVAHFYYANFLTGRSRFDEAIAEANEAVRLDPVSMVAESNLAILYSHAGRYGEALESCRKALEMEPNLAQPYDDLGRILQVPRISRVANRRHARICAVRRLVSRRRTVYHNRALWRINHNHFGITRGSTLCSINSWDRFRSFC